MRLGNLRVKFLGGVLVNFFPHFFLVRKNISLYTGVVPPTIGPDGTIYVGAGGYLLAINSTCEGLATDAPLAHVSPGRQIYRLDAVHGTRSFAFNTVG